MSGSRQYGITAYPENNRPRHKPLSEGLKGALIVGTSAICGVSLQSRDFYLGLDYDFLFVIEEIVVNLPNNNHQ